MTSRFWPRLSYALCAGLVCGHTALAQTASQTNDRTLSNKNARFEAFELDFARKQMETAIANFEQDKFGYDCDRDLFTLAVKQGNKQNIEIGEQIIPEDLGSLIGDIATLKEAGLETCAVYSNPENTYFLRASVVRAEQVQACTTVPEAVLWFNGVYPQLSIGFKAAAPVQ